MWDVIDKGELIQGIHVHTCAVAWEKLGAANKWASSLNFWF